MTALVPYLLLPGTAAEALAFYRSVFGGETVAHTYAEFGRADGPADAIAHGMLLNGPVELGLSDAAADEDALHMNGLFFSLLGTADPETLTHWFARLGDGGRVLDPLQERPWGAHDGTLVDRFGVRWLIGYEG
ncbi:VOC family protein [uncultured Microbacterium sp.]|uniref:VOC family protein n=1 Tax=uncultured Microbacterium sp. TaxID=191216 RepID=UPI0025EA909B|nr:VOC family protein [uncultured Microbacterium sp.]